MAELDSFPLGDFEVNLDGVTVEIPLERRSFAAIRSYLESLALLQQRIICSMNIDGEPVNLAHPRNSSKEFTQVEAETMDLNEIPTQLIQSARQQTATLRERIQTAVELVLINNLQTARELWWTLASTLKDPLVTLSLLPDHICGPSQGRASLTQLRKWQLQQLGGIIQEVDAASREENTALISEALEKRVLPWLNGLLESLNLWQETVLSSPELQEIPDNARR